MVMVMMMMMMNTNAMPALEGKVIFLGPFPPAWSIVEISPFLRHDRLATDDDVLCEISRLAPGFCLIAPRSVSF